mmetsp:Transcript_86616/g.230076  ORF Transcript_86616/g.230076 Transcript_86616/m.230076 type:complete len:208 (+) Transcript_86616:814-1437(+)
MAGARGLPQDGRLHAHARAENRFSAGLHGADVVRALAREAEDLPLRHLCHPAERLDASEARAAARIALPRPAGLQPQLHGPRPRDPHHARQGHVLLAEHLGSGRHAGQPRLQRAGDRPRHRHHVPREQGAHRGSRGLRAAREGQAGARRPPLHRGAQPRDRGRAEPADPGRRHGPRSRLHLRPLALHRLLPRGQVSGTGQLAWILQY